MPPNINPNLNDVLNKFQLDVGLVHDFVKGDENVVVVGDEGTYPSLAKIAADSISNINTVVQTGQDNLALMQVAIDTIINDYQLALLSLARVSAVRIFNFDLSLEWVVEHNLNTLSFSEVIFNVLGERVYAPITIIDNNRFKIEFTEPEAGVITVTFNLNN